MDTIETVAAANALALPQRKGDLHFISNRAHLHSRTAYADDTRNRGRHLMRLALMDSVFGVALEKPEQEQWGHLFDYPPNEAKWTLDYDHPDWFASSGQFDKLYRDETSHTSS